jgi:hypothetical protein
MDKGHNGVQCTLVQALQVYKKDGSPTCCTLDSMLITHSNAVHSPYILALPMRLEHDSGGRGQQDEVVTLFQYLSWL